MSYNELKPKGDGTFYLPIKKREDGSAYVPAEYKNVNKKCQCKSPGYCTNLLDLHHKVHICFKCGAILSSCRALG